MRHLDFRLSESLWAYISKFNVNRKEDEREFYYMQNQCDMFSHVQTKWQVKEETSKHIAPNQIKPSRARPNKCIFEFSNGIGTKNLVLTFINMLNVYCRQKNANFSYGSRQIAYNSHCSFICVFFKCSDFPFIRMKKFFYGKLCLVH